MGGCPQGRPRRRRHPCRPKPTVTLAGLGCALSAGERPIGCGSSRNAASGDPEQGSVWRQHVGCGGRHVAWRPSTSVRGLHAAKSDPSTPTWAAARKCGCSRPVTCAAEGSSPRTTAQRGANGTVAAASKVSDSLDACRATMPVATTSGPAGVEPQEVPDVRTDLMMCQGPRLAADDEAAPGARLRGSRRCRRAGRGCL